MECKLAPLQRMDLRAIEIWNQGLVSTWAEKLDLSPKQATTKAYKKRD